MRRTLAACRAGLSVAAAVVLLSACGSSGNDNSAASSSSARSSASETSAGGGQRFCAQAAAALASVAPTLSGSENDPGALATALQQGADKVRAIQPPSEISSDWTALADGIQQIAQTVKEEGTGTSASASAQQRVDALVGQLTTAATNVQTYLSDKCGLQTPTGTAAPTS